MIDEPAKRWLQAIGFPLSSRPADSRSKKYGRYMSCWMSSSRVHTIFTGPSTCCAICNGASDAVGLEPPAEAAADQMVVHDDLLQRQTGNLRRRRLAACHGLRADPDFAAVLADMNRAVHRLHRRVREERNLVGRHDLGDGTCHRLVDVPDALRDRSRIERGLLSSRATSSVVSVASGPSSHSITRAASPFFAAPMWSATTATQSSSRTICCTPLTAFAAVSSRSSHDRRRRAIARASRT